LVDGSWLMVLGWWLVVGGSWLILFKKMKKRTQHQNIDKDFNHLTKSSAFLISERKC